ncbi:MAG: PAS domain S-box protein, partial [Gammaproteobacteria bacterium]|nr:PAS domain S-box protein [Gammaproteobacteria bacterium]
MTADTKPTAVESKSPKLQAKHQQSATDTNPMVMTIERWQQAFDASPDLISIHDIHHRILFANKAMAESAGCSTLDAQGRQCYQLLHQSDCPPFGCPHNALLEDGQEHRSEIYEDRLNIWLLVSVTPIYNAAGELTGSIHIARDITHLKQIEQALRESEERYRQLSEATLEGVLLSAESRILATNKVLADMLGYSMEELPGMRLVKFVAPKDRERLIRYLKDRQTGVYEFLCIKRDGTTFPVETHSRSVTYKGRIVFQTAIRDLTEQKLAEKEHISHERLQGVLEMAGAVCHELNQPLMALTGYMEILELKLENDDPMGDKLVKMSKQMVRIQEITRKLMQ